ALAQPIRARQRRISASLQYRTCQRAAAERRFVPKGDIRIAADFVIGSRLRRDRCQPIQRSANARPHNQSAFIPWICQSVVAERGDPPPAPDAPWSSHITTGPVVVLYQRMSLSPSWLKSPVSTIAHGLGAEPGEPPPTTLVPLSNHATT